MSLWTFLVRVNNTVSGSIRSGLTRIPCFYRGTKTFKGTYLDIPFLHNFVAKWSKDHEASLLSMTSTKTQSNSRPHHLQPNESCSRLQTRVITPMTTTVILAGGLGSSEELFWKAASWWEIILILSQFHIRTTRMIPALMSTLKKLLIRSQNFDWFDTVLSLQAQLQHPRQPCETVNFQSAKRSESTAACCIPDERNLLWVRCKQEEDFKSHRCWSTPRANLVRNKADIHQPRKELAWWSI